MIVDTTNPTSVAAAAAWVMKSHGHAVIGTADPSGTPWAIPVNRAYDFDGRVTWKSRTDARHSQYLALNPHASVVIFSSHATEGDAALYMEGPVEIITDTSELELTVKMRYEQAGKPVPPISDFQFDAPDRVYRLTPTSVWITEQTHTKTLVDPKLFVAALGG